MITNPSGLDLSKFYKCNKRIMEYLVYQCGLSAVTIVENSYYFARTKKLDEALEKMPKTVKFLSIWLR